MPSIAVRRLARRVLVSLSSILVITSIAWGNLMKFEKIETSHFNFFEVYQIYNTDWM